MPQGKLHAIWCLKGLGVLASRFPLELPNLSRASRSGVGAGLADRFVALREGEASSGRLQALFRALVSKEDARLKVARIFEAQVQVAIGDIEGLCRAPERAGLASSFLLGVAYAQDKARRYKVRVTTPFFRFKPKVEYNSLAICAKLLWSNARWRQDYFGR